MEFRIECLKRSACHDSSANANGIGEYNCCGANLYGRIHADGDPLPTVFVS